VETRCGPNKDGKFDFGKNLNLLRIKGNEGQMEVDDDGGEMEIQFDEV